MCTPPTYPTNPTSRVCIASGPSTFTCMTNLHQVSPNSTTFSPQCAHLSPIRQCPPALDTDMLRRPHIIGGRIEFLSDEMA
eukprot:2844557-Pyramimonas_sp.AAC.2